MTPSSAIGRSPLASPAARGFALGLLLVLGACAQRVGGSTSPARGQATAPAGAALETPGAPVDPRTQRLAELDRLLVEWDRAQVQGRTAQAAETAQHLRTAADAAWSDLVAAHGGQSGDDGRYLATMALGFSGRAEATGLLVESLKSPDPRLVANALIALKLRADPATPVLPVAFYVGSAQADVRRYAPLALAHVLEARRGAGQAPDLDLEARLLPRLSPSLRDRDVLVRLHAARLLGEFSSAESLPPLRVLLRDPSTRIQLAAGAALARRADPDSFPEVVRLLHQAPESGKTLVTPVLALYAERLSGAPLADEERRRMGVSGIAWSRWYADWHRAHTRRE